MPRSSIIFNAGIVLVVLLIFAKMLIFLDIDGVMVPAKSWKTPELLEDGFPMFTQKSTDALKSLLSPKTRVILSTSHRHRFSVAQWKQIFEKRGLRISRLGRLSASGPMPTKRKDEIQEWFKSHPVPKEFVILDDDKSLHALPQSLKNHWIETSAYVGLTPQLIKQLSLFAISA